MTQNLWKKLFIVSTVLLLISVILGACLWHQLNEAKIGLDSTTTQLDASKLEIDSLKDKQDRLLSGYANLTKQIRLRLGTGQDCQFFVTPDDPLISAKVQEITGGYSEEELWKDYGRLFRWIIRNIQYSTDSPIPLLPESINGTLEWGQDFWRLPAETIRDQAGDCEDMAVLLVSMLLNYNQRRFPVWIVGVKTSVPTPKAHLAVAIPSENNQLTIFDVAAHYYTPFQTIGGFGSQEIPLAIEHWLNHLEEELSGAQIYIVFSENSYHELSGTEEFIDWVNELFD